MIAKLIFGSVNVLFVNVADAARSVVFEVLSTLPSPTVVAVGAVHPALPFSHTEAPPPDEPGARPFADVVVENRLPACADDNVCNPTLPAGIVPVDEARVTVTSR